ncbi:hypothetical protein [Streptomyces sp. NPDC058295]|uniref:hypothetical protein n=1 Tax=Streptomyces sp. NPDC058295 TaxID=3346431 RepID=UPI0036E489A2
MHFFTIDRAKDRPDPRVLMHRSFYASSLPRVMAVCRLFGHKPVVDGYDSQYGPENRRHARWVACERCGVRPDPQGNLNADRWQLGQPYPGPFNGRHFPKEAAHQLAKRGIPYQTPTQPGPWPAQPTGTLAAEVVVGRAHSTGIGVKVGNPGDEHTLQAHLGLGPLGACYLTSERFGTWVQRRLNNEGFQTREIDLSIHSGRLWWKVWARENEHHASDPKWMDGNVHIDPRHHLLGPRRNRKISETDRMPVTVYMPEGDTHQATVHLEQWQSRRTRGRATTYWMAQWDCEAGIPVRNHEWKGDHTYSCAWQIEHVTPDTERWPYILAAKAAEQCTRDRAHYGYRAPEPAA